MQRQRPFRASAQFRAAWAPLGFALILGTLSPALNAQLPAATATASSAQQTPARTPHRSQVTFDSGLLTIIASNASLNGLIREIGHQTGMKISGSVAEDHVFGIYGPADPQRVLAILLDGTGSNVLIRSSAADAPLELILTPRTGAPTPPNPNANVAQNDEDDDPSPPPGAPTTVSAPRARPAVRPGSVTPPSPTANGTDPASSAAPAAPADASATPAAGTPPAAGTDTGTPANSSADSVKTPQQIFDQLQRLRQQSTPNTPTPQ